MSDTPSSLPYTPEEHRVLAACLECEPLVPLDPKLTLRVALRRLGYRGNCKVQPMAWVAAAGILLQEVYQSLPQHGPLISKTGNGESVRFRRFQGRVPEFPVRFGTREILTIVWSFGEKITCPEAYWLAWLPGYDRWVMTMSHSGEVPVYYPDQLICSFGKVDNPRRVVARVLEQCWELHQAHGQARWVDILRDSPLLSAEKAIRIGARVWPQAAEKVPA